ncbi:uncharacterized protein LOC119097285 [Pollicipes pollicipes]|uniref:uncharacterized protein LOC119097285 n=1 Tax=Pollicipes pollicipes TaxID=41117 RepID=UPI00188523FC|nr:uncharacterized protein LOC119097285 [Pollicipes pollicipes]
MVKHGNKGQIDEDEAYQLQMQFVDEWKPSTDTLFLRYGTAGLATMAAACGMVVTSHYRSVLKLRSIGLIAGHMPIMAIAACNAGLLHQLLVSRDILLFETTCPACVNMRATAIQLGAAVALPVAMASISSFHLAERKLTYPLPRLADDPRNWLATWRRLEFFTMLDKVHQEERWRELSAG